MSGRPGLPSPDRRGILWLIARRTVARRWKNLVATLAACAVSVGLLAGSLQFILQVETALAAAHATEYARASVVISPADADSGVGGHGRAGAAGFTPATLARLRRVPGVGAVAGDTVLPATLVGPAGQVVPPSAGGTTSLRSWTADPALSPYRLVSGRAPVAPGEIVVDRHAARAGGLNVGSRATLLLPLRTQHVTVVGIALVDGAAAVASGDLVLAAPRAVQSAAGDGDTWQELWVRAAPGLTAAMLAGRIRDTASTTGRVATGQAVAARELTAAGLRGSQAAAGLGMLTLIGVFVALYVVSGTFGSLVRQRSRELALLGAVGASPRQVAALVHLEALLTGAVAGLAGLVLGIPFAKVLASQLGGSGLDITGVPLQVTPVYVIVPLVCAPLAMLAAALRAARQASRVPPVQGLRDAAAPPPIWSWRRMTGFLLLAATAAGWVLVAFVGRREYPGPQGVASAGAGIVFGGLTAICALAVLLPLLATPVSWGVGSLWVWLSPDVGRIARAAATRSPRRIASVASLLMLTVALASVAWLLNDSISATARQASLRQFTGSAVVVAASGHGLPKDTSAAVAAGPGVRESAAVIGVRGRVVSPLPRPPRGRAPGIPPLSLNGVDGKAFTSLVSLGAARRPIDRLRDGQVVVSAALAKAYRWRVGTVVVVNGAAGRVNLVVTGTIDVPFSPFAQDGVITRGSAERLDPAAFTRMLLVRLRHSDKALPALNATLAGVPTARVYGPAAFADHAGTTPYGAGLTTVFLAEAVLTALFGVASGASLAVAERTRELGILRAVGASERQLGTLVVQETATVVTLGVLLGTATASAIVWLTGLATGSSLIAVRWSPLSLGIVVAGAALATLAVAGLPARRAGLVPVLDAIRQE